MSRMTNVLHVPLQEPSKSFKSMVMMMQFLTHFMVETLNSAHMFEGTCDHKMLGHWAKGPPKPPTGVRMSITGRFMT